MAIFRFHLKDGADPVTLSVSGKGQILDRFLKELSVIAINRIKSTNLFTFKWQYATSLTYHQLFQHKFPNSFPGKTGGSQNSLDLLEDVDRVGVPVVYWVTSICFSGGRSQLWKRNQGRFWCGERNLSNGHYQWSYWIVFSQGNRSYLVLINTWWQTKTTWTNSRPSLSARRQPCKWVAALEEWTPFCETFRITVKSFFQLECLQDLEFIIPGSEAKY